MGLHNAQTGADLHVPGYLTGSDPGAVGAGIYWVDTTSGTGLWILKVRNAGNTDWEVVADPSAATPDGDEKAKVSANDTTAGYLNGKLVAGDGIDLTEGSDGGNETLTIAAEAASDTNAGIVEMATTAEIDAGTATDRANSPDALAGSYAGTKSCVLYAVADGTDVDTTSGILYFNIPPALNGMNLVYANAYVTTAGTTNATTAQVRNMTKYASNDALSAAISIASGATNGTAGTVDTSYDDVATGDLIKCYITGQSTTKPKGLRFNLEFRLP